MQPNKYTHTPIPKESVSDSSIVLTAVICSLVLFIVIGMAILWGTFKKDPSLPAVEMNKAENKPLQELTRFQEGYAMSLPTGFKLGSREEIDQDCTVYRFRSEEGYRLTVAIISDDSIGTFTKPPQDYSNALIKRVPELSHGVEDDVVPVRLAVDGMSATVFRFYERETFRGVNYTYCMVAMEKGVKLVLKITGKYGGYREDDDSITMPRYWYDALLTLQHVDPVQAPRENATTGPSETPLREAVEPPVKEPNEKPATEPVKEPSERLRSLLQ